MHPPYRELEPPPALQGLVARIWELHMPSPQRFERIVPLTTVHLIVNRADAPYRVVARGREPIGLEFPGAFLSGLQLDYLLNENPADLHHVGAELHPWALGAFGVDAADAAQRVQDASGVLPGAGDVGDVEGMARFLVERLVPGWSPDARIVAAVGAIRAAPNRPMRELADDAGLTPKGFIAAFRRACGVTPKRFAAICRHQAFLAELPTEGELPRWSELVGDSYYDPPHFIREFRRFTGMTPTAYLEHRRRFGHGDPSFLPLDDELLEAELRG